MISRARLCVVPFKSILIFVGVSISVMFLLPSIFARHQPENGVPTASGWDREAAAKYMDERMDVWFVNAKKLRAGQTETSCVSCHTTVPYVIARPALRRVMKVRDATAQETRIVEETTRRVETYSARQPLYDHSESKKTESRGTEAVLNALILASADASQDKRKPGAVTQQAFEQLWEAQRPDGAWDWLDFGLEPYESADGGYYGATLAAMAVGIAPGLSASQDARAREATDRLRGYLKEKYPSQSLFNRVWLLLASTRLNGLLTSSQREALVADMQSRQRSDGGWSLESLATWRWSKVAAPFHPPAARDESLLSQSDGFATGLMVYALRKGSLSASGPAVSRGLQWLKANMRDFQIGEHAWHAWRAHSLNFDREHGGEKGEPWRRMFMSDSATAFAVLALLDAN